MTMPRTPSSEASSDLRPPLWGKYRGVVVNNVDPLMEGRIQVSLADAGAFIPLSSWATPCLPFAGLQSGMVAVPAVGAGVWVEFEQGELDRPIWVGGFWGSSAELPALAKLTPPSLSAVTLQTQLGNGILISDSPTIGLMIKSGLATITVNEAGIVIDNGKGSMIVMSGKVIDFNQAALTVGP